MVNGLQLIDYVVELTEPILWLSFTLFLWRRSPPQTIERLYPLEVRLLWLLPFSARWREKTALEHQEQVRRYRRGAFAYSIAILSLPLLRGLYYEFFFVKLHSPP